MHQSIPLCRAVLLIFICITWIICLVFYCVSLDSINKIRYNIPVIAPFSGALRVHMKTGLGVRSERAGNLPFPFRFLSSHTALRHDPGIFPFTAKKEGQSHETLTLSPFAYHTDSVTRTCRLGGRCHQSVVCIRPSELQQRREHRAHRARETGAGKRPYDPYYGQQEECI